MAEFIMKKMVADEGREEEFEIASAATSTEEIGNDVYPPAIACLRRHGIPFSPRGARRITPSDYAYYDKIYIMDINNRRWLDRMMPDPEAKITMLMSVAGETRDVADPWYTGDFEATYRDLHLAIGELLRR